MSHLTSRQRQFVYLAGILVLMVPIIWLGVPTTTTGSALGIISQKRIAYGLGEPNLGKVDPASSTMNLVLLGMRGVAANLLWMEAEEHKKKKNWSQLDTTVESIILLQPHYQKVWEYQAWNLTYNVSAECDAVADRWFWVKKGMKFMIRGTARNERVPELYHATGDFFGKKVGRSDEKREFREFWRHDPDTDRWQGGTDEEINPDKIDDNYLVARQWYQKANTASKVKGVEQHKMAAPLFESYPTRSLMDYAAAMQDEGVFGERTREAWSSAYDEWTGTYGRTEFDTPGGKITFEATKEELAKMSEVDKVPLDQKLEWQDRYQNMVNYRYWKLRCEAEGLSDMADARRAFALGRKQFREEQEMAKAQKTLYDGLEKLQSVADRYRRPPPDNHSALLTDDDELTEEIIKAILIWQHITRDVLGEPIPEEFPLDEVWNDPNYESMRNDMSEQFQRWQGQGVSIGK
jgi:hypothetical protein